MAKNFGFTEGDVVKHKSNSDFKMVIVFIDENELEEDETNDAFQCCWLDKRGVPHTEDFKHYELEKFLYL